VASKRFRKEPVSARTQRPFASGETRCRDDRRRGVAAYSPELLHELIAVQVRHHEVDDDQLGSAIAPSQSLRAVFRDDDLVSHPVRISRYSSSIIGSSSMTRIFAIRLKFWVLANRIPIPLAVRSSSSWVATPAPMRSSSERGRRSESLRW
jgi:hypothetical protein